MYDTMCTKITVMGTQIYSHVYIPISFVCVLPSDNMRLHSGKEALPTWTHMRASRDLQRLQSLPGGELFCPEPPWLTSASAEHESLREIAAGQLPLLQQPWPARWHGLKLCCRECSSISAIHSTWGQLRQLTLPYCPALAAPDTWYQKRTPTCRCIPRSESDPGQFSNLTI